MSSNRYCVILTSLVGREVYAVVDVKRGIQIAKDMTKADARLFARAKENRRDKRRALP